MEKVEIRGHALGAEERVSEAEPSSSLLIPGFSVFPDFVVFPASWSGADASHIPALNTSSITSLRCFWTFYSDRSPDKYRFVYLREDPAILLRKEEERRRKEGLAMSKKKEKPIDLKNLEPEEKLKYEVAEELGLLDKVLSQGWKSLTSKETGRIGGLVTKKKKHEQ